MKRAGETLTGKIGKETLSKKKETITQEKIKKREMSLMKERKK